MRKIFKKIADKLFVNKALLPDGTHGYKSNVKIIRRDCDGNVVFTHESHNMIVASGRIRDTNILYGTQTTNLSITKIKIGKGGAPSEDPFNPTPPADTDTGLATPLASPDSVKTIQASEKSLLAPTTIFYDFIFFAGEIDDYVNEAVLTFNDDVCFARYTFPSQPLLAMYGGSIEIKWEISNVNVS